jgi:hypothetical protein
VLRTLFLLLAAAAIVLVVVWLRTRDRRCLYGLGGVAGVALALWLGTLTVRYFRGESDADQIERKLHDMSGAVRAKNVDGIFQHVSDDFGPAKGSKEALRTVVQQNLEQGGLTDVEVQGIEPPQVTRPAQGPATATVRFRVRPASADGRYIRFVLIDARFILDPDGQWRLKSFRATDPSDNGQIDLRYPTE